MSGRTGGWRSPVTARSRVSPSCGQRSRVRSRQITMCTPTIAAADWARHCWTRSRHVSPSCPSARQTARSVMCSCGARTRTWSAAPRSSGAASRPAGSTSRWRGTCPQDLAAPVWPAGIVGRGFRPGLDDRAVYEADIEAFSEHHLYEPRPYDEWRACHIDAPDGDVTLWWLAWDGDQLAGYVIPFARDVGSRDRRPRREKAMARSRHRARSPARRLRDASRAGPHGGPPLRRRPERHRRRGVYARPACMWRAAST